MSQRDINGTAYEVIELKCGDATAELWPALGGNCVRWHTAMAGDILWSPPMEELVGRPTRGGIPVLFPFPNRIRGGRFSFGGHDYQLPCNDSTKANAIHGFSPRLPWHVNATAATSVTLSFRINRDAPECSKLWPGDIELALTWELTSTALSCRAEVRNQNSGPVPFGLGFHPYFRLTGPNDRISVPASGRWELVESLPTGTIIPVDAAFDLRQPRRVGDLSLDDVYTHLDISDHQPGPLVVGRLLRADGWSVAVRVSADFREMVVFTPPHGKAVCLEPYTCPTDAVNLAARGIDAGWKQLLAGGVWSAEVQYELGRG
jgi:aldose 1-epimerase